MCRKIINYEIYILVVLLLYRNRLYYWYIQPCSILVTVTVPLNIYHTLTPSRTSPDLSFDSCRRYVNRVYVYRCCLAGRPKYVLVGGGFRATEEESSLAVIRLRHNIPNGRDRRGKWFTFVFCDHLVVVWIYLPCILFLEPPVRGQWAG